MEEIKLFDVQKNFGISREVGVTLKLNIISR